MESTNKYSHNFEFWSPFCSNHDLHSREAKAQRGRTSHNNTPWVGCRRISTKLPLKKRFLRSTLFVSNLPYTATSVDLQTLFSDIAPVRSAFVVTEHGTGVSKGVGYVSFAIKEDAQSAFDKIAKEGLSLVGRNLRVQWAESKVRLLYSDKRVLTHQRSAA